MPRLKRADDWTSFPTPNTPLQRGAFLDVCTQWLTQHTEASPLPDVPTVRSSPPPTSLPPPLPPSSAPRNDEERLLSFSYSEASMLLSTGCITCGSTRKGRLPIANPFVQRCFVQMCETCLRTASSTSVSQ